MRRVFQSHNRKKRWVKATKPLPRASKVESKVVFVKMDKIKKQKSAKQKSRQKQRNRRQWISKFGVLETQNWSSMPRKWQSWRWHVYQHGHARRFWPHWRSRGLWGGGHFRRRLVHLQSRDSDPVFGSPTSREKDLEVTEAARGLNHEPHSQIIIWERTHPNAGIYF